MVLFCPLLQRDIPQGYLRSQVGLWVQVLSQQTAAHGLGQSCAWWPGLGRVPSLPGQGLVIAGLGSRHRRAAPAGEDGGTACTVVSVT